MGNRPTLQWNRVIQLCFDVRSLCRLMRQSRRIAFQMLPMRSCWAAECNYTMVYGWWMIIFGYTTHFGSGEERAIISAFQGASDKPADPCASVHSLHTYTATSSRASRLSADSIELARWCRKNGSGCRYQSSWTQIRWWSWPAVRAS